MRAHHYESITIRPIVDARIIDFISRFDFSSIPTPAHILFPEILTSNISLFRSAYEQAGMDSNIFYSCKSNKSRSFLAVAAQENCGIEVSSLYELKDALQYTNNIIASGPAKSDVYLEFAVNNGVTISVDDIAELELLVAFGKQAKVLLRLSDLLGVLSRFGINKSQIEKCLEIIAKSKLLFEGFAFHINNYSLEDRISSIKELLKISNDLGISPRIIDIGGGFPTRYCSQEDYEKFLRYNSSSMFLFNHGINSFYPYWANYEGACAVEYILCSCSENLGKTKLVIEPGRSLLSNCGITVFETMYLKTVYSGENIVVVNGNINSLSEQWFGSEFLVEPLLLSSQLKDNTFLASVAGNLCLEQDVLSWRKIKLGAKPVRGDKLIYFNTAGYQMDSNESCFCKFPLPPKFVARKDNDWRLEGDVDYDC